MLGAIRSYMQSVWIHESLVLVTRVNSKSQRQIGGMKVVQWPVHGENGEKMASIQWLQKFGIILHKARSVNNIKVDSHQKSRHNWPQRTSPVINKIQDTRPFGVLDYIPWWFSCALHCGSKGSLMVLRRLPALRISYALAESSICIFNSQSAK